MLFSNAANVTIEKDRVKKKTLLKQINVKKHARIKINSLRLQSFDDVPLKQSQKPKNLPCTTLYGRIFCGQHEQHNT